MFYNFISRFFRPTTVPQSVCLVDRMNVLKWRSEDYSDYCPFVVSLHSKKILEAINFVESVDKKMESLYWYRSIFVDVCRKLYNRFDPSMIYIMNNEIHMVFYRSLETPDPLYMGNIHTLLSTITSFATRELDRYLGQSLDFTFVARYIEFPKEYEVLNYLVYRQLDCRRNNTTLLYKCLFKDAHYEGTLDINGLSVEDMTQILAEKGVESGKFTDLEATFNGVTLKRTETATARKTIEVITPIFSSGFRDNFQKLIAEKTAPR